MEIAVIVVAFLIDLTFSAAFLWVGMKVASFAAGIPGGGQYCSFLDLVKVAAGASLAALDKRQDFPPHHFILGIELIDHRQMIVMLHAGEFRAGAVALAEFCQQ